MPSMLTKNEENTTCTPTKNQSAKKISERIRSKRPKSLAAQLQQSESNPAPATSTNIAPSTKPCSSLTRLNHLASDRWSGEKRSAKLYTLANVPIVMICTPSSA